MPVASRDLQIQGRTDVRWAVAYAAAELPVGVALALALTFIERLDFPGALLLLLFCGGAGIGLVGYLAVSATVLGLNGSFKLFRAGRVGREALLGLCVAAYQGLMLWLALSLVAR